MFCGIAFLVKLSSALEAVFSFKRFYEFYVKFPIVRREILSVK